MRFKLMCKSIRAINTLMGQNTDQALSALPATAITDINVTVNKLDNESL